MTIICYFSYIQVTSKPHGKHHGLRKTSPKAKEKVMQNFWKIILFESLHNFIWCNEYFPFLPYKDFILEEANKAQILPTLVTFEASNQEPEDEELSSEDNANANKKDGETEIRERTDKSSAVLLSEEELVDLLKKEAEEEEETEKRELEEHMDEDKGEKEAGETVEDEEAEEEEKKLEENLEMEEDSKDVTEEKVKEESMEDTEMLEEEDKMVEKVEKMSPKEKEEDSVSQMNEDGSTDSEVPVDLDYAADSGILHPLQIFSAKVKPHTDDDHPMSKTDVPDDKKKEISEKGFIHPPSTADDYEQDMQNTEAMDSEESSDQDNLQEGKESQAKPEERNGDKKVPKVDIDSQEPKSSTDLESSSRKEEEKRKNDSGSHTKGKTRKEKKNQRARKHSPQREETESGQEESQQDAQESEGSNIDNTVHKAKRRRAGKWVQHLKYVYLFFLDICY